MDVSDLALLDTVIMMGGVSGAARQLGQPKATISRRIRSLETALGEPIFDRTSRRLRLTRLGESLAEPAAAVRIALSEAEAAVAAILAAPGGCLQICAPFLFGRLVLSPYVGKFLAGNRSAMVTLRFSNHRVDPLRDGVDFAVHIGEPAEPYLVRVKLANAQLRLYAAPAVAKSILEVSQLASCEAINTANPEAGELIWSLHDRLHAYEIQPRVICTVNDPEAACLITAGGRGVAALPEFLAAPMVESNELAPVLPRLSAGGIGIFAAMPPGRQSIPLIRQFLDGLKAELGRQRFAQKVTP